MRKRKYTSPTSFLMTPEMYDRVIEETDSLQIGISDFIRARIDEYFKTKQQDREKGVNKQ
jgi:hypothetical protein